MEETMQAIMDAVFGVNGSAHLQFLVYVFLGMSVGWVVSRPCAWSDWLTTVLVIGASGAWLGAEVACLIGQADRGGLIQLAAATTGAGGLVYVWRLLHPRPDIAARLSRA